MSEFKFACPVCGQHITCDSAKSGTQLNCPTCFQKLLVPNAPQGDISKLVLNAALARSRISPLNGSAPKANGSARPSATGFPIATLGWVALVLGIAFAAFGIRSTFSTQPPPVVKTNAPVAVPDWTLNLSGISIPDAPIVGRINEVEFSTPHVQFQNDTLNFRVGAKPLDLGLMIMFGKGLPELAGRAFAFETNSVAAPRILLRWKNDQGKLVGQYLLQGYALKVEFKPIAGNHLAGKIYFCATNAANSYAAGAFDAEILRASASKPHSTQKLRRSR